MTVVRNLSTGAERHYSCSPREAVIASHAQTQSHPDYNTWNYEQRYGHLVVESQRAFYLRDWAAFKAEPTHVTKGGRP